MERNGNHVPGVSKLDSEKRLCQFCFFSFLSFFFEIQLFQLLASISNLDLFHYCHKAPSQFGETKHGSAFDTTPKVGPTRSPLFVG